MGPTEQPAPTPWPACRKIAFRFFFIYFLFQLAPWTWFEDIPGIGYLNGFYHESVDWMVRSANRYIFHVREVLVPTGGSGDTSFGWADLWLYLLLAATGGLVWTLLDRKRPNYRIADYWMRTAVRYYLALSSLFYGIWKLFANQMPFPGWSELAVPLGDFLPMRLSWMFFGYSAPYQIFGGVLETVAGLCLLYRRTVTLGLCLGAGIFGNVAMLNLCYDIPVKIYSMQLFLYCLFLLAYEWKRLLQFFVLNSLAGPTSLYTPPFTHRWMRIGRVVLKSIFILLAVVLNFQHSWENYRNVQRRKDLYPIRSGLYEVETFVRNHDTIPAAAGDSLRWSNVAFDKSGVGSVGSPDSLFNLRYRRGYFIYAPDTPNQIIRLQKTRADTTSLMVLHYAIPDSNTLQLRTVFRGDSLFVSLRRSHRHFQLTERQFHWISEANR